KRARFLVKDAGVNAIYAMDLQSMERLAKAIGDDPERYARRRRRVLDSMMRLMWDEKDAAFYDVREPGSRKIRIRTPTILFPLLVEELDQAVARRIVETHL